MTEVETVEEIIEEVTPQEVVEQVSEAANLELGEKASKFITSTVSRWAFPTGTRGVTKGKCFNVINQHNECLGTFEILDTETRNVLLINHKEAIEMGHVSHYAFLVDWFYTNDHEAYMDWARGRVLHPTRLTNEFRDFIGSRPDKVCKVKMIVLQFVKRTKEAEQSGGG